MVPTIQLPSYCMIVLYKDTYMYIYISNPKQLSCKKKCAALRKAMVKKDVKFKVAGKKRL